MTSGGFTGQPGKPATLPGLTLPGLANTHSHAFHRALRGRTQRERGTFWTWREQMYAVAERLDPDSYHRLATAVFREMVAAGMTGRGGVPLPPPPARRDAVRRPERDVPRRSSRRRGRPGSGSRCSTPATSPAASASRRRACSGGSATATSTAGASASARCRPRDGVVARRRDPLASARSRPRRCRRSRSGRPAGRCTPTSPSRSPRTTPASRPTPAPRSSCSPTTTSSARSRPRCTPPTSPTTTSGCSPGPRTYAGFCPTTERDLGDGIGPGRRLHEAGVRADPGQRQPRGGRPVRGDAGAGARRAARHPAARPLDRRRAAPRRRRRRGTPASAGPTPARSPSGSAPTWSPLDTASPRTAGTGADEHTAVFAATAADVVHVVVDGRVVVDAAPTDERARLRPGRRDREDLA